VDPASVHFQKTMRHLENGQYQLRLSKKENWPRLPSNIQIAKKRALSMAEKWKRRILKFLRCTMIRSRAKWKKVEEIPEEEIEASALELLIVDLLIFQNTCAVRPVFNASLGSPSLKTVFIHDQIMCRWWLTSFWECGYISSSLLMTIGKRFFT
jgi:hypothetical protein